VKLYTLMFIVSLMTLCTAAAFLYYVPVMSILTADAVAAGFLSAFGAGLYTGRRVRRRQVRLRLPSIPRIDRTLSSDIR